MGRGWRQLSFILATTTAVLSLLLPHRAQASEVVAVPRIIARDTRLSTDQAEKATTLLEVESGYRTIPRSQIRAWIDGQKAESYKACYDEACQIELGKAVAAQKILVSEWSAFGTDCVLTVRLIDLRTELAEVSTQAQGACTETGLRAAITEAGRRLRARTEQGHAAFQLDLSEAKRIKNPPTDDKGYLRIRSEAAGRPEERIEVWINGDLAGPVVHGLFTTELRVGHYLILLRTAGDRYAHERREVDLGKDGVRIPRDGVLTLRPIFGTLLFDGVPGEVTVSIDRQARTVRAPHREEIRSGKHEVVIEAPGHLPFGPTEIEVQPGEEHKVAYRLDRNAGGLSIVGSPSGAVVSIDGKRVGALPLSLSDVDIGDRTVEVEAPGHYREQRLVRVQRGATSTLELNLKAKRARLKVEAAATLQGETVPVEADVYVDGTRVGTTPWKDEVLAEVEHEVQLRLGELLGPSTRVALREGEERREVMPAPERWAGASASIRFDLVPGPWSVRSGSGALDPAEPNAVRPGRWPIELLLNGEKVGTAEVQAKPDQEVVLRVMERPRTPEELEHSAKLWTVRKWAATGATVVAAAFGMQQLITANIAASERDEAYAALRVASVPEEVSGYRSSVIDLEDSRDRSVTISAVALGAAAGLAVWAATEWLFGEPSVGTLIGDGVTPVSSVGER
ncbi:MAG: PEGA domain-containing protein [Deltaproteobacteria bacterium]|nr:PEGA domain-containing protein [Deltaproteobacteria bacterium]